jgi:thymidylate synthase (FAD)
MRKQILDHGYIEVIEHWGSDERIVEAARMSTGKGFLGWGGYGCPDGTITDRGKIHEVDCRCKGTGKIVGDEKLLKYLMDNRHHTPFEMAGMIIEVQAPIMVFREWHRHRTQSYNEMSARYTPMPDVNYMPTPERCMMVSAANKQAGAVKGADELTHESVLAWLEELSAVYVHAEQVYQSGLKRGIPKEVARLPVPVGRYSRMRASTCLRNWLAFLTLRSEHVASGQAAQFEIRQFANAAGDFIGERFPRTWELFAGAPR